MILDETKCAKGAPIRSLFTADEARIVKHFLNNFSVRLWENPYTEVDRSDPSGAWIIRIPASDSDSSTAYRSYFRLVDITDAENGCRLAVTNGETTPESAYCGTVKVNGSSIYVATFTGDAITSAGTIYFWIHTWRDAVDGYDAEIRITTSSMRPDNPNGGIAWASEPVGSCTIESDGGGGYRVKAGTLRQDFLKGGDHLEILTANCSGEV